MRIHAVLALLLLASLAGCFGDKGDKDDDHDHGDAPEATAVLLLNLTIGNQTFRFSSAASAPAGPVNGTAGSASATPTVGGNASAGGNATAAAGNATGNATGPSGEAPLDVAFELGATGLPAAATALRWELDFGGSRAGNATGNATAGGNATAAGNATAPRAVNGTALPASANHTYVAAGRYNVTFVLRVGNATAQALQASLVIANGTLESVGKPLPDQVHFEFGESLGCTGDTPAGITCIDWESGPPGDDIDGHWIPLTELYWGLDLTSMVVQTPLGPDPVLGAGEDTDCLFVDADLAILEQANNGSSPCAGRVPDGAAWLFIYPYGAPAIEMSVDFWPPAPE